MPDTAQTTTPGQIQTPIQPAGPGLAKELEVKDSGGLEAAGLKEVGREVELPKEVAAAGVKVQPTTVTIPPPVQKLGVKPVGPAPLPPPTGAALPLTDDQIAAGLKQSLTSSWRWLAEWCLRKLKQLHLVIKSVHGKIVRVRT